MSLSLRTADSRIILMLLWHWAQKDPAELNTFPKSYPESHEISDFIISHVSATRLTEVQWIFFPASHWPHSTVDLACS